METRFTLLISFDLPQGKLTYGKFSLGKELETAQEIFSSLKGEIQPPKTRHILLEFFEEIEGLPVPLGKLNCCLDHLKENLGIISKEIFRIAHLENGDSTLLNL